MPRLFEQGAPVFVEGRLQLDQWEGPEGEKRAGCECGRTECNFYRGVAGVQGRGQGEDDLPRVVRLERVRVVGREPRRRERFLKTMYLSKKPKKKRKHKL